MFFTNLRILICFVSVECRSSRKSFSGAINNLASHQRGELIFLHYIKTGKCENLEIFQQQGIWFLESLEKSLLGAQTCWKFGQFVVFLGFRSCITDSFSVCVEISGNAETLPMQQFDKNLRKKSLFGAQTCCKFGHFVVFLGLWSCITD